MLVKLPEVAVEMVQAHVGAADMEYVSIIGHPGLRTPP